MTKIYHSKKYLIEQLKSKTYIQIAKENKVSPDTIQHHMNKHGLTKKRISWTKKEIQLLKDNYESNPDVYKLFPDRSVSSLNHKASKFGLKKKIRIRKYSINHNFFKEWNSKMAYTLGMLFSDGHISNNRQYITINLNKKDHDILEKLNKIIGSNRLIRVYGDASRLRLDSKILTEDLIKLGCTPRKTKTLRFPGVMDKFLPHFIRGYFDGDGSIHFNNPNTIKVSFVGTKEFLEEMQVRLNNLLQVKNSPITKTKTIWRVVYYGNNARRLCYWMYKNSKDLYLKRKKDRFDKHIELRKNGV